MPGRFLPRSRWRGFGVYNLPTEFYLCSYLFDGVRLEGTTLLSVLAKILLTASSIAPVSLTYAWVAYMQEESRVAWISLSVGIAAVLSCLGILRYARDTLEEVPFQLGSIEPVDNEHIGFMLLYILPLFTDSITTLHWEIWLPVIIVFAIIIGTGFGYYFNPLLGLLQWHFYRVTSTDGVTYVIITRKHIRSVAEELRVGQLTEYMLLDLGRRDG